MAMSRCLRGASRGECRSRHGTAARLGFTLIEVLVAVALFALAASLALGGLSAITRARTQLDGDMQRIAALQFAIGLIERDMRSAALRPIRDGFGAARPPLSGRTDSLEISRYGAVGLLAQTQSDIARIGYQRDGERLLRLRFPVLDRGPSTAPMIEPLLNGVERVEWRYMGAGGSQWLVQWPPPRGADDLPRAIELRLELSDFGEIRRVFELPTGIAP